MMPPIRHTMLVANAGSGKTHALTTRMVKLLALGVDPRRIAALTFTKKAAGEFLDAVFLRLAEAALDSQALDRLNEALNSVESEGNVPPLDAADCRRILLLLVRDAGRLTMGTIDSLFARIARSFPLESGLPGDFAMIGESELERARTEALSAILRDGVRGGEFLDQVRKISRRGGERSVFRTLLDSAREFHAKYLSDPALPWGDRNLIWNGRSCPILESGEVRPAAEALMEEILKEHPGLAEAAQGLWRNGLDLASAQRPEAVWPEELKSFVKDRLIKVTDKEGELYIPMGNSRAARVYLRGRIGELRREVLLALLKPVYASLLERSAALRGFMQAFEKTYHSLTRSGGAMTFSDVTDLLSARTGSHGWTASAGYRLDTSLDHWLLDEFQDTSRIQWKVLGSFIDEVIQDSGGERSLFYVGDTKQAIYSWRGGDPRLFFEIFERYNRGREPRLFKRDLAVSYRSAPEIVNMVNSVFGRERIRSIAGELGIPERTVTAWGEAWRDHDVAEKNRTLPGYVRWDAVVTEDEDENPVHRRVAAILTKVMPWERGLSCAVLTRKNEQAAAIAALLQSEGIPVSVEGKSNPCNDNPLGIALLAAYRVAGFPGDSLSLGVLLSSPLSGLLSGGEDVFRAAALDLIASRGYEATARRWLEGVTLNPFLTRRSVDFLSAAALYDAGTRGPIADFTAFLGSHMVQESEAPGVVRVMTVHQSKGLTFDMSIVVGLDGRGAMTSEILHLGGGIPPTWACLLPRKDFAAQDAVMATAVDEILADEEYGKLCTAYVAMTRSRQALYLVTTKLPAKSQSKNFARLLTLTLHPGSDTVAWGEEDWFEGHPPITRAEGEVGTSSPALVACVAGTPRPVSPSARAHEPLSAASSGASFSPDAADLGTEVHEVLSRIGWDATVADLSACSPEAGRLLRAFLASGEAAGIFMRPVGGRGEWEFWNEKPFDLVVEGEWVSGCFDRVHVRRENGLPVEAEILDYKTNRSTPEAIARRYEGQMSLYVQAASCLLGLPADRITARTVPVRVT